jgi:hypothetical protein
MLAPWASTSPPPLLKRMTMEKYVNHKIVIRNKKEGYKDRLDSWRKCV